MTSSQTKGAVGPLSLESLLNLLEGGFLHLLLLLGQMNPLSGLPNPLEGALLLLLLPVAGQKNPLGGPCNPSEGANYYYWRAVHTYNLEMMLLDSLDSKLMVTSLGTPNSLDGMAEERIFGLMLCSMKILA